MTIEYIGGSYTIEKVNGQYVWQATVATSDGTVKTHTGKAPSKRAAEGNAKAYIAYWRNR